MFKREKIKPFHIFIFIVISEIIVFYLLARFPAWRPIITPLLIGIIVFIALAYYKKYSENLIRIYGLFNNRFSTTLGFIQLIAILIHFGLLTDALHDFIKLALNNEASCASQHQLLNYLSFLFFYLLIPTQLKPESSYPKGRKVLILPLSVIEEDERANGSEIPKIIIAIKNIVTYYNSKGAELSHILLLSNKTVEESIAAFLKKYDLANGTVYGQSGVENFLKYQLTENQNIRIDYENIKADANNFESYYQEVEPLVEGYIKSLESENIKDENTTFSVLQGNKIIGISMAFLAMPKSRGAVYINQQTQVVNEFNLSVLNVKKLWNELLNRLAE